MKIKTINLTHIFDKGSFNEFKAIDNINIEINKNEFITIVGRTGSGKTTFIEHLNALLRPTFGSVEFISNDLAKTLDVNKRKLKRNKEISDIAFLIDNNKRKIKEIKKLRKQIGVVFQFAEYQLFEETIEKDIVFGPISMGVPKDEAYNKAEEYLEMVGLPSEYLKRSPFALSGGQKRRVALAGILSMEPDVLIFDEPTAGLDPQGEKDMYDIFHKLHKNGKTIIIVTHNMDHVLEHSKRTIVFNDGKVVRDGKTIDIMYDDKFMHSNELEIPKIVDLVKILESKGKKIGKVNNIEELTKKIKKK